jgi:hypothetical protein
LQEFSGVFRNFSNVEKLLGVFRILKIIQEVQEFSGIFRNFGEF